jgi:hypothetical protein
MVQDRVLNENNEFVVMGDQEQEKVQMLLVEAERMKRKIELLSEERAKLYDELQRCKVENKELLEVNKQLVEKIKTKKK